jgi:hypothetical protein
MDRKSNTLTTYDSKGQRKKSATMPKKSGDPKLSRGEDNRVYVESDDGDHVLVVDNDGEVTGVPVNGEDGNSNRPAAQPENPPAAEPPANPPPTTQPPQPPPKQQQPRQQQPKQQPKPQRPAPPPQVPPTPPGAPGAVNATAGNASAVVNWTPAPDNRSPITRYTISWPGGSITAAGGARTATVNGLANGTAYVFTVSATNGIGTGPGVSTSRVTPVAPPPVVSPPGRPPNLAIEAVTKHSWARVTWGDAAPNGAPVTAYHVHWIRDDGSREGEVTLPGTANSYRIELIWEGEDVPFTVTVTAENSAGVGAPATAHKAPPP